MTINEIAVEAHKLHLSYGQYVATYKPTTHTKPVEKPHKLCQLCHKPIVGKGGQSRYCHECGQKNRDRLMRERAKRKREGGKEKSYE